MKKLLILLISLVLICIPAMVSADLITPGEKMIYNYYVLSNASAFADYEFFVFGKNPMMDFKQINYDEPFIFYKFNSPSVYAIKKDKVNFDVAELEQAWTNGDEEKIINVFENNPDMLKSDLELSSIYDTVPESNPLDKVETVLFISSLNENSFELAKQKMVFSYTDGSSEERFFGEENFNDLLNPSESDVATQQDWSYLYWALPFFALIVIAFFIFTRKMKRVK